MTDTSALMQEDHEKISNLLENFQQNPSEESLEKFKWTLEKHLFIEEKITLSIIEKIENEEVAEIQEITKQHQEITNILKEMEKQIPEIQPEIIQKLKETIDDHLNYENIHLYPKLENLLTKQEKELLVSRVKEIIK